MEEEIKQLRQDIEHLRDEFYGNGGKSGVASHLQRLADSQEQIRADILGVKEEVRGVKDQMKNTNGAVNQLKLDAATAMGATLEREKWEQKQAANLKWIFMAGLGAAGLLSGIVFGAIDRLTQ